MKNSCNFTVSSGAAKCQAEIDELAAEIERHDDLYWNQNTPEISDVEYDILVLRLHTLAPEHPVLHKVHASIPTVRVDITFPSGVFRHERPMLSLAKAYTQEEVLAWAHSVARGPDEEFEVSPKFDGLACEIGPGYAATRGDGEVGELITDKLPVIDLSLKTKETERGELVVYRQDLAKIRRSDGTPYKTLRSAAAGLVNLKETDSSIGQILRFIPHSWVLGLVARHELAEVDLVGTLEEELLMEYPVDGLVIRLADEEYGESLGATDHHPRNAIAFKIANPSTTAKLLDVEWQCGKQHISPVAVLEPTELDGVTIERATLHNLRQIKKLGISIGAVVKLERAGSVIPAVTGCVKPGTTAILPPAACPACGAETCNDTQDVWCSNEICGGAAAKKLKDALERLQFEDCGPALCSALVGMGYDTPARVLSMTFDECLMVPWFAATAATKFHSQILRRRSEPTDDYRLLAAMNFPGVGLTLSKKICDVFTLAEIAAGVDLTSIPGVGPATAAAIDLSGPDWLDLVVSLNIRGTKGQSSRPTFCCTGPDPWGWGRDKFVKWAEEHGYAFHKGVTKTLKVLVCASAESGSMKAEKARKYGTRVLTYEEFKGEINDADQV